MGEYEKAMKSRQDAISFMSSGCRLLCQDDKPELTVKEMMAKLPPETGDSLYSFVVHDTRMLKKLSDNPESIVEGGLFIHDPVIKMTEWLQRVFKAICNVNYDADMNYVLGTWAKSSDNNTKKLFTAYANVCILYQVRWGEKHPLSQVNVTLKADASENAIQSVHDDIVNYPGMIQQERARNALKNVCFSTLSREEYDSAFEAFAQKFEFDFDQ